MMNLYEYWWPGAFKSIQANICFWSMFYRPAGALYYLPLHHFFLLDPLPYRIVQISILAATIPIVFCLARLLSGSHAVAFLVALAMCYHGQMANLMFSGSFIYDVLCGFFYFAALTYYVSIREKGMTLRPGQLAIFLALYICALNSKEMAVSLPVMLLIYEALKCPWLGNWNEFFWHNRCVAIPVLVATVVTVIYVYAKMNGPYSLANLQAYRPVYSWHRFTLNNAHFVNDLLYESTSRIGRGILFAWPVVFFYAFWRRDRLLQLMAFWIVTTPLPLAFILPRGGAVLYIVLFGWATIFARMLTDLIGVDRRGAGIRRIEDSHTACFRHSRCGGRVRRFHALAKSAISEDSSAAQLWAEVASRHTGIPLVKPASISRQLDLVETRNAFLSKRILSRFRCVASLE